MTSPDLSPAPTLIDALTRLRHDLHRHPELSGAETRTAQMILDWLRPLRPDEVIIGLGGQGVAAIFQGDQPGATVMLRCELDGLPIEDLSEVAHRSQIAGRGHLCGHDGHMAVLAGVADALAQRRPASGRVILLFQPAEEDGAGAAAVIADPRYDRITPDFAFALHNFPGLPLGMARIAPGAMNCASRGMRLTLRGRTAHASMPDTGVSPAPALARLITALTALSRNVPVTDPDFRLVTITHLRLGEPAFGIAPGEAQLWATLRSRDDQGMGALVAEAEGLARSHAARDRLAAGIAYDDIFLACQNDPQATAAIRAALDAEAIPHDDADLPMRASEDFGRFGANSRAAMFLLGAGENRPALHNPDYDFPDALIPIGIRIFTRIIRQMLG